MVFNVQSNDSRVSEDQFSKDYNSEITTSGDLPDSSDDPESDSRVSEDKFSKDQILENRNQVHEENFSAEDISNGRSPGLTVFM